MEKIKMEKIFIAMYYNYDMEFLRRLLVGQFMICINRDTALNPWRHLHDHALDIFWSILVLEYGDYGVSPRVGWIDRENFDTVIELFDDCIWG